MLETRHFRGHPQISFFNRIDFHGTELEPAARRFALRHDVGRHLETVNRPIIAKGGFHPT
jgi:hypothetical protein